MFLLYSANDFCQTEAHKLSAPPPDLAETGQWAQGKDWRISEASFLHEVGLKLILFWKEAEDWGAKYREVPGDEYNRYPTASETRLVFVIPNFYTAGHALPQNKQLCRDRVKPFTALLKDKGIWGTQTESDSCLTCSIILLNMEWIHLEIPDKHDSFLNWYCD